MSTKTLMDYQLTVFDHKPEGVHISVDLSKHKNVKWFYHNGKWHYAVRHEGRCPSGHTGGCYHAFPC